jgi:adenylate cyclase
MLHTMTGFSDDAIETRNFANQTVLGAIEWLSGDECHDIDDAGLIAGLGRRLRTAGLPVDQVALHLRTLHPEILGRTLCWEPNGLVEIRDREHGIQFSPNFARSPVRYAMEHNENVNIRFDRKDSADWTLIDIYQDRDLIELLICPLTTTSGPLSAASFATRRVGGFSDLERDAINRVIPALRTCCELRTLRKVELTLLDTYTGATTAQRILAGRIRRGEVETLEAALMLCDLRGFTELSNRLSGACVVELLDTYFDLVMPAIADAGGEVVKFMGDAVLAFFPGEDPSDACTRALRAARAALDRLAGYQGREALHAGIALHYGEVSYGNIGSGRRLDFTVIGPDVNLISRIQSVCSSGGFSLLGSARFAQLASEASPVSIGKHGLKGFEAPTELFQFEEQALTR